MSLTHSITPQELRRTPYTTVPDRPYVIRSGKRVLPVYDNTASAWYSISVDVRVTTVDWKFFGTNAFILSPGIWNALQQKRRCKAVFIPLDKPLPSEYTAGSLIGFIAASVDIQQLSIATGQPLPKKPKRKNKKALGYSSGQPINNMPAQAITTSSSAGSAITWVQSIPTHINTTTRKSDGYIVYSTDSTAKMLKDEISYHSMSSPGTIYTVKVYKDSSVSCNCPAWTRKVPRSCKHIVDDTTIHVIKR